MKYGICSEFTGAANALAAGFDYVEVGATSFVALDPFDPAPYRAAHAEASNLFFPSSIRLFDSGSAPYLEYAEKVIGRASQIGIQVMVIGSGASRFAPESGYDERFAKIAAEVNAIAGRYGIKIAPESLNRTETNVGNDLGTFARILRDHGVGYTADTYHVLFEWAAEGGAGAPSAQHWAEQIPFAPTHVHIANLPRFAPQPDDSMLHGFVDRLRELGYDSRVSLECMLPGADVATLRHALDGLKALFAR
ncbi:sugar phosphate isomerase/epimerase family protein [Fimbriimonas ginsengisoli]|uniref:Xylose isomerase n=1 Tax=Fimbriimonas ginsengisoli Gsoil 348 TaxID=661478 RepID=A0A068NUS9_FIMGI|nr:sugar phosphate isomerase/epimerase family protein [Fimbriimonas ginsengisoli]AIE87298.1 xylose isomerase [Fimbriimonas ginsengisoli Gsoil 348]